MKKASIWAVATLVLALALLAPSPAMASTYTNSYNGSESVAYQPTTLIYSSHSTFRLRVRVTPALLPLGIPDRYSIAMYDSSGRRVWSASDQRDRVYSIGSNVTKIVIKPVAYFSATTRWSRA